MGRQELSNNIWNSNESKGGLVDRCWYCNWGGKDPARCQHLHKVTWQARRKHGCWEKETIKNDGEE